MYVLYRNYFSHYFNSNNCSLCGLKMIYIYNIQKSVSLTIKQMSNNKLITNKKHMQFYDLLF